MADGDFENTMSIHIHRQLQEKCERLATENALLRGEVSVQRVEIVRLTRELHGYAYMLTKAQLAARVSECELAMLSLEYERLRSQLVENDNTKKESQESIQKENRQQKAAE